MPSTSGRLPVSVLATREIALIGTAILAGAIALAVTAQTRHHTTTGTSTVWPW